MLGGKASVLSLIAIQNGSVRTACFAAQRCTRIDLALAISSSRTMDSVDVRGRYTERARRVLYFARNEASRRGSPFVETEHLLLGLIREGKGLTRRLFGEAHLSLD